MSEASTPGSPPLRGWNLSGWLARRIADPRLQDRISRLPGLRRVARRDGEDIFDILQGFVASQALLALVETGLLRRLLDGPQDPAALAALAGLPPDRAQVLLRAGIALGLLRARRDGRIGLARRGAAILGVPGLEAMIRHNRAFYADMADPVGLLRGGGPTRLQQFWPYVQAGGDSVQPAEAAQYSDLMAQSQILVARDTLRMVPLRGVAHLLDLGGGSGVFLAEALRQQPGLGATLVDLPAVIPTARARLAQAGQAGRVRLVGGDFRRDGLPEGADAISLIRVAYDHADDTVANLLAQVHAALPPGGRLILSEPMSGGDRADPACDLYFAFYTMAMGTGRLRSPRRLARMCREAGFAHVTLPRPPRPFITSALLARKAG